MKLFSGSFSFGWYRLYAEHAAEIWVLTGGTR